MRRLARQREAIVAAGLLFSALGTSDAGAAETRLIARCAEPSEAAGGASAILTCDVRAGGFAVFNDVKAAVKGDKDGLDARFEAYDPSDRGTTTAYLIQLMPSARRTTLSQMGDAVVTFTDQRLGKRTTVGCGQKGGITHASIRKQSARGAGYPPRRMGQPAASQALKRSLTLARLALHQSSLAIAICFRFSGEVGSTLARSAEIVW